MEFSAENLLVSLKGAFKQGEERQQIFESQARRRKNGGCLMRNRRTRRVLMKNRKRATNSSRAASGINRKVKTLKKLIPNSESMGMEGLFRETAEYIVALQMRVRVMQIMVKVLNGSDNE